MVPGDLLNIIVLCKSLVKPRFAGAGRERKSPLFKRLRGSPAEKKIKPGVGVFFRVPVNPRPLTQRMEPEKGKLSCKPFIHNHFRTRGSAITLALDRYSVGLNGAGCNELGSRGAKSGRSTGPKPVVGPVVVHYLRLVNVLLYAK